MQIVTKEVFFDKYCQKCMYEKREEHLEPCDTCLTNPVNEYSHKPVSFKKKPGEPDPFYKRGGR